MSRDNSKTLFFSKFNIGPDPYFDLEGFDFCVWKICIFIFGILCAVPYYILMLNINLRNVLVFASFLAMSIFLICNIIFNIKNRRLLNESVFVLAAGLLCIFVSDFTSSLLIVFLFNMMKLIEVYLSDKQRAKTGAILDLLPDNVVAIDGSNATTKKPSRIKAGDYIGVNVGEVIPVDGVVVDGESTVDYSNLVNSNFCITVNIGSNILSGGINKDDVIIIQSTSDYNESFIFKLYDYFSNSVNEDPHDVSKFRYYLKYWSILFFFMIVLFGIIIPIFKGSWQESFRICIYLCILACPYSFLSIIQYSSNIALQKLFSYGVYIKNSSYISKLGKITALISNKTQTLTENDFIIEDVFPIGLNITSFLSLVTSVESISSHPIANALRNYCGISDYSIPESLKAKEMSGKGIVASIEGTSVLIGNATLMHDNNIIFEPINRSGILVYVAVNCKYCGYIVFSNKLRSDSFDSMESIKKHSIHNLVLLSGDMQSVTRPIANALGFNVQKTEASLEDKINVVDYLMDNRTSGNCIAYVGNSIFESSAASHADISIATDMFSYINYFDYSNVNILSSGISGVANALNCASTYSISLKFIYLCTFVSKFFAAVMLIIGIVDFWIVFIICLLTAVVPIFIIKYLYGRL